MEKLRKHVGKIVLGRDDLLGKETWSLFLKDRYGERSRRRWEGMQKSPKNKFPVQLEENREIMCASLALTEALYARTRDGNSQKGMRSCPTHFPHFTTGTCLSQEYFLFSSVQFSRSVMSDSLRPHGMQHARLPCPSPTPGVYSDSCPLSQWCYPLSSPSLPAFNLAQHQGLFKWVSSSYQVAKVLEFQLQHQSFQWIFRTELL